MSWCCYGRSHNEAKRRAERPEMERHKKILLADNRPARQSPRSWSTARKRRVNPISVTDLRPKFRSWRMKKI
jgi:hypothetical protein